MTALIPIFDGLVRDCSIVIFGLMDGHGRHVMSVVSKDWNVWCNENVKKISSDKQTASAIKDGDMLSIVQNYKYINEQCCNTSYRACKSQNMELINFLIRRDRFNLSNGLCGACKSGNVELVKFVIEKCLQSTMLDIEYDWNIYFKFACKSGSQDVIQLILTNGVDNWNYGLAGACASNLVELAHVAIRNGADNWNDGLIIACRHGCIDTINLMIEKGANDWNLGLREACYDGNIMVVQLMIKKGANDWNIGLEMACRHNHIKIVQLMIEKGANKCYHCYEFIAGGHAKVCKLANA